MCVLRVRVRTAWYFWCTCLCSVVNSPVYISHICKHISHEEGCSFDGFFKPWFVNRLPTGAYEVCFPLRSNSQNRWEDPKIGKQENVGSSSGSSYQLGHCEASPFELGCHLLYEKPHSPSVPAASVLGPEKGRGLE